MLNLVVLAGPNGAGKSTAAPALLQGALGVTEFVNADVIAQGLSAFDPDRVALAAGRIMIRRVQELARQGVSFAFSNSRSALTFLYDLCRKALSESILCLMWRV